MSWRGWQRLDSNETIVFDGDDNEALWFSNSIRSIRRLVFSLELSLPLEPVRIKSNYENYSLRKYGIWIIVQPAPFDLVRTEHCARLCYMNSWLVLSCFPWRTWDLVTQVWPPCPSLSIPGTRNGLLSLFLHSNLDCVCSSCMSIWLCFPITYHVKPCSQCDAWPCYRDW